MIDPFVERVSRRNWLRGVGSLVAILGLPVEVSAANDSEIRIACVGDSMIDGIWGGLERLISKEPCLKSRIVLGRFGENGSGLTRADKFSWEEHVRSIVASFKPHLVLVSLGLNDRQMIVDSAGKRQADYGSTAWPGAYVQAIDQFLRNGATAPAGLLWLGIPIMRDDEARADATEKNASYAAAVRRLGNPKARFCEPWHLAEGQEEKFRAYAPDSSGMRVQIRAPDGIHFTPLGYDRVAAYLWPQIVDHLRQNSIALDYPCGK